MDVVAIFLIMALSLYPTHGSASGSLEKPTYRGIVPPKKEVSDDMSNEMSIELVLKAWRFLLDYHGLEAELEIVDGEEE